MYSTAFVACSTKIAEHRDFRTASDKGCGRGLGTRLPHVRDEQMLASRPRVSAVLYAIGVCASWGDLGTRSEYKSDALSR